MKRSESNLSLASKELVRDATNASMSCCTHSITAPRFGGGGGGEAGDDDAATPAAAGAAGGPKPSRATNLTAFSTIAFRLSTATTRRRRGEDDEGDDDGDDGDEEPAATLARCAPTKRSHK